MTNRIEYSFYMSKLVIAWLISSRNHEIVEINKRYCEETELEIDYRWKNRLE